MMQRKYVNFASLDAATALDLVELFSLTKDVELVLHRDNDLIALLVVADLHEQERADIVADLRKRMATAATK